MAEQQVGRSQETGDELSARVMVELLRPIDLQQAAEAHHADVVGNLEGFLLVVGNEDGGHVQLALDLAQRAAQLDADLGIQRAQRLVQQQNVRLDGQGARQGDALLLAAGKLARHALA